MAAGGVVAPRSVEFLQPWQVRCNHRRFLRRGAEHALVESDNVTPPIETEQVRHFGQLEDRREAWARVLGVFDRPETPTQGKGFGDAKRRQKKRVPQGDRFRLEVL
jgi:hypothetical protein